MKGHIRERSPGHWAIVIDVRDPKTGQAQAQMAFLPGQQARRPSAMRAVDYRNERWRVCGA
jgi:hypothetical protein